MILRARITAVTLCFIL